MGTVVQTFEPLAGFNTGSVTAELYVPSSGPTLTPGWAFTNPGTNLEICFPSQAINYGGGNAVIQIDWYCLAATSGTATWKAKVIATTPGDAESVEAADNATSTTSSATTVNGTAGGLTRTTITVSALDSMASGDKIWIKVQRDTADTSIAQTIYLTEVVFNYGDGLTGTPGSGDVVGPSSATDNAVVRFDGTTGKLIQDSVVTIADTSGNMAGVGTLNTRTIANWVDGPASATDGRVVVYDGTTGKLVKNGTKLEADVVAGPASATSGRIAVYNGTTGKLLQDGTKLEADVVAGPASATSGWVAVYNGTTGKLLQDGTKLETDLATGPASSTSGNIASFNGTGGKTLQDSGVSATAHASRHIPGGADSVFGGTWSADDIPVWNGSSFDPSFSFGAELSSDFTVASASAADITGLTVSLPRAGTYVAEFSGQFTTGGTSSTVILGANYTGTVTRISITGVMSTSSAGNFIYITSLSNNGNGTCPTGANLTIAALLVVRIVVSTTGTFSIRAARSNNAVCKAGSGFTIRQI